MTRGSIVIEGQFRVPADVFDLARFREWVHSAEFPKGGRVSFIGGEIEVEMSPEEIESHNKLKTRLAAVLDRHVDETRAGGSLVRRRSSRARGSRPCDGARSSILHLARSRIEGRELSRESEEERALRGGRWLAGARRGDREPEFGSKGQSASP